MIVLPIGAGRVFSPGTDPAGCATVPSLFTATAAPSPFPDMVKMPGENCATVRFRAADARPSRVTTTVAVPTCGPQGSCALTWLGDTNCSGAGVLLKLTDTPANELESGTLLAEASADASSVPKMETSEPGATANPGCPAVA